MLSVSIAIAPTVVTYLLARPCVRRLEVEYMYHTVRLRLEI